MKRLVQRLKALDKDDLTFERLGKVIREIDFDQIEYKHLIRKSTDPKNYGRNILLHEPLECVLVHWAKGVESAVHHHENFWGYVVVLEGELDNIEYRFEEGVIHEITAVRGFQYGIIPEKNGVIHKLCNSGKNEAVTLHFYYPPLESFQGMKIFDVERKRIGVLNNTALTSSWSEPAENFEKIISHAFEFVPYDKEKKATHRIYPVIPKPDKKRIEEMIADYYNEQAKEYDYFDIHHESRKAYTEKINQLIADDIKMTDNIRNMLMIGCGTGRRAEGIQKMSGLDYQITGIDLSPAMCNEARGRGIKTICKKWIEADLNGETFDAATYLYSFGHLTGRKERLESLKKVNKSLVLNATLYIDVFNINDQNEWGPKAVEYFEKHRLFECGYERGDVFYKKTSGKEIAFLHYFSSDEIQELLEEASFKIEDILHIGYVKKSGKILDAENEGALYIKAVKEEEIS